MNINYYTIVFGKCWFIPSFHKFPIPHSPPMKLLVKSPVLLLLESRFFKDGVLESPRLQVFHDFFWRV